jgi:agmatine deiminase
VPAIFAELVQHLSVNEEVHINVDGPDAEAGVRELLRHRGVAPGRVFFHHHPTNDAWCRDHGPVYVQRETGGRKEEAILDWDYNAWGNKYPPYHLDDVIPTRVATEFGIPVFHPGIVMEGGSLDVNGA